MIEGGFGPKPEDEKTTLKEALTKCLELSELADVKDGKFLLVIDSGDRFTFMTNQKELGSVLILTELVKTSVMAQVMAPDDEDGAA